MRHCLSESTTSNHFADLFLVFSFIYFYKLPDLCCLDRLWDVRSGKIVHTLETKSFVTSAEVSQDGRYITSADGSTVKFWDANQ